MIILIAMSYFTYGSTRGLNINLGYFFPFMVAGVFVFLFAIIYMQTKKGLQKKQVKAFVLLLMPEILIIIYTLFVWIIYSYDNSYFSRGISNMLLYTVPIIQSLCIIYLYKDKAIDIIFKGTILNYTIVILFFVFQNGLIALFQTIYLTIFNNTDIMTVLEAHQVTFVIGILLIYYILNEPKKNKFKIVISIFYLILGLKRILIAGILVALLITFIISKLKNKNIINATISVLGIIMILFSYIWIYAIKTGTLEKISDKESIDFMYRFNFYNSVSNVYEVSPSYIGKGIGFVSKWIYENNNTTIGLHSDLLKKYIEYGFYMYGIYLYYRFNYITKKTYLHCGKRALLTYISLIITTLFCWLTDNVAGYYVYILAFSVICMQLWSKEELNE